MSGMSFDFLNQTCPLAAATTTVIKHETTLQNEIFLLTGALCNLVNSRNADAASLIELWNDFITLAYQSLPVVDDARVLLLNFFAFEREFKKIMNPDDLRWLAAAMQMRRIKGGIVLLKIIDADEVAV